MHSPRDRRLSQLPNTQDAAQHREGEVVARRLRSAREESTDPAQRGPSLMFGHDQQPRTGRKRRDERVGATTLPVWELDLLRRAEPGDHADRGKVQARRRCAPAAQRVTWADGRASADPPQLGNQSTRSSMTFHKPAMMPPGASTRAISGPAAAMSNQCRAFPASTASTDASGPRAGQSAGAGCSVGARTSVN